jgi:phosphate transport system protein
MNLLLDIPISKIRETLLLMSSLTGRNFMLAIQALKERDDKLAGRVEEEDDRLDQLEIEIDEQVIGYMATRGPVATDCRFALAASKISSNLERIGDEATTIARRSRLLNQEPPLGPGFDLAGMVEITSKMLNDSITAFIEKNPELALEIVARDNAVDDRHRRLVRDLTVYMKENEGGINRCISLIRIVKCIERIADHAANIAEDVYYLYRGRDIRHGGAEQEQALLQNAAAETEPGK